MSDVSKTESVNETVSTEPSKTKPKRKFNWTPARRAAFEKCIAARKKGLLSKPSSSSCCNDKEVCKEEKEKRKTKKRKVYVSSSESESDSESDSESSIDMDKIRKSKLKHVIKKQIQKSFPSYSEETPKQYYQSTPARYYYI
jgi:hypothetical protein